jgi:hypothetical protein
MVHSTRLERWGGGPVACSGEMVVVHWVEMLAVEASTSGSLGTMLEVQSLHLEWRTLTMHRWANHIRVPEERS